jgi:hypothetical protein
MLGFKLPGLFINTKTPGLYPTTLKESQIKALKERLDNFDFRMGTKEQYMEVESIMNILNGTLDDNEADQMDLAGLFLVLNKIKYHRETWRQQPDQFVNVLLKIVERIKGQVGGMNPPRHFILPTRQGASRTLIPNTRKINNITNNNYDAYPMPNFKIPVGNAESNAVSEEQHMFNLFELPYLEAQKKEIEAKRQQTVKREARRKQLLKDVKREALLRNVLSNTKKRGGTRKNKLPKSNTPEFRKQVINTIRSRINLTNTHKAMLIQRYEDAAKAGLATPNEISALVTLAQLKTTRRRR